MANGTHKKNSQLKHRSEGTGQSDRPRKGILV